MKSQEVISFIKSHLLSRSEFYRLYSQVDDLTGGARIDKINVIDLMSGHIYNRASKLSLL
jgi:hypothetical protein